jgi:hypothetical protein
MKKISLIYIFVLIFTLFIPQVTSANMAAPKYADIGSSISFEKNDTILVLSEVLDITVNGSEADIVATYKMKNNSNESISTQSMFISPNVENGGVKVIVNNKDTSFKVGRYVLNNYTEVKTDDWKYAVLTNTQIPSDFGGQSVDTITFTMNFEPNEEYDVVVYYTYKLGGYPDYDFDVKRGEIKYYLTPAAMWKNFSSLTINLYLDKDMPIIKSSNLKFKKIATRTYQYVSDILPNENLDIVIDENWYQNIFSTLRSPYLPMILMMFSPFILIVLVVIILIIWYFYKRNKLKSQN